MCGISGIINFNGITENQNEDIILINQALHHRGPNNEGYFNSDMVNFGHQRLAIIDINELANQPMTDINNEIIVTFNGEIFNHAELRSELESKYDFKTNHSDTEVIIYAYKEWGIDCIQRFTGQFAIALYDKTIGSVFLIRDRIGQKPLYYSHTGDSTYFSSEIKSLLTSKKIKNSLNEEAIYDYLTLLTTKAPKTFFNQISKVESGCYIEITRDKKISHRYWDVANYLKTPIMDSEQEAILKTEELLEKSMRLRNIADIPLTYAISGGLDSSLNLYYAKTIGSNIDAINISFDVDNKFNESKIAEQYCSKLDVPLKTIVINKSDIETGISDFFKVQPDMPIGDPNSILMYILAKETKKNGRHILMVGEGGDEIGGYPKYLKTLKRNRVLKSLQFILKPLIQSTSFRLKSLDYFFNDTIIPKSQIHGFTEAEKNKLWRSKSKPRSTYVSMYETMSEVNLNTNDRYLRQILNLEYKIRLPEMILARIDYPTMANSVEARSPLC